MEKDARLNTPKIVLIFLCLVLCLLVSGRIYSQNDLIRISISEEVTLDLDFGKLTDDYSDSKRFLIQADKNFPIGKIVVWANQDWLDARLEDERGEHYYAREIQADELIFLRITVRASQSPTLGDYIDTVSLLYLAGGESETQKVASFSVSFEKISKFEKIDKTPYLKAVILGLGAVFVVISSVLSYKRFVKLSDSKGLTRLVLGVVVVFSVYLFISLFGSSDWNLPPASWVATAVYIVLTAVACRVIGTFQIEFKNVLELVFYASAMVIACSLGIITSKIEDNAFSVTLVLAFLTGLPIGVFLNPKMWK